MTLWEPRPRLAVSGLLVGLLGVVGCAESVERQPSSSADEPGTNRDSASATTESSDEPPSTFKDTDTSILEATGGDDCAHAIDVSLAEGQRVRYLGDFADYGDHLDPTASGCVGAADKPEVFFRLSVPPWHVLLVEERGIINTTVHVLDACETLACLATSDPLGTDSREVFNSTDTTLPVIIAVETNRATSGPFDVTLSLELRPPGTTCDYAIVVPAGGHWSWEAASWAGYHDTFSSGAPGCPSIPSMPLAQDVWFSVTVPKGELLAARDPRGEAVFGAHEVALLSSCDASTCLKGEGGPTSGSTVLWNDSAQDRTYSLVLQRSLDLDTPPALEVDVGPPGPGEVCATAVAIAPESLPHERLGVWTELLDTGSSNDACQLPTPAGGGEDVWFSFRVPAGEVLAVADTAPLYYSTNLALIALCEAHECLASGQGGLSFENTALAPLDVWLHAERVSSAQTPSYALSFTSLPSQAGRSCEHPLTVSDLPQIVTLDAGLLGYGDELSLADPACGAAATGRPELVLAIAADQGQRIGVAAAGGGSLLNLAVLQSCEAEGACLAFSKTGTLVYEPAQAGPVLVAVEAPYSVKELVLTIYEP